MCIYHCGSDIAVPQQFLNGSDITLSTLPNSLPRTCLKKNNNALNAWFCDEADTFDSTARKVKKSFREFRIIKLPTFVWRALDSGYGIH